MDNDSDGLPDNKLVIQAIRKSGGGVVMYATERAARAVDVHRHIPERVWDSMSLVELYGEETHPGGAARGLFDATYEEILHLITSAGYANAYPDVFGEKPGTAIAEAMDKARGAHFRKVPRRYPNGAWFTYDDKTCDYACQITEYIYWGLTSILGAQDFPGRLEDISEEWRLNTAAKVEKGDPSLYKLLTDPKYAFPTTLPDGKYNPRKNAERDAEGDAVNRAPHLKRWQQRKEGGTKHLEVDCAKVVGRIRSLLGTNRGPLSFPRRPGEQLVNHVESYRALGIDFIRTHDFYGPTDWHIIFPDWSADPDDRASYDFRSSDERIRPIVDNGFRCFYRLGTSWKGRQKRPINDPPGTIRGPDGKIIHRADRNDFRKWAKICAKTVLHYTKGWKNGFHYPIEYWEVWNEPDLAAQFWTGTPEQYYMMYEETAKAIKEMNPKLKVGGPACTGGLQEAYVEKFIQYCHDNEVPLDFFSWHSYGGRGDFNPYQHYVDAMRIRKALDKYRFDKAENINTEWNAGIQHRLFSDTPAGAAFYASALANFLDAGVDHAFQYCGDRHPGLGLHDFSTGEPKISAYSFLAWKRLLDVPNQVAATGSDQQGYNIVAGKDADGRHVRILISDFQSGHDGFRLQISNLPWDDATPFTVKRSLLDGEHRRLDTVEQFGDKGRALTLEKPFTSGSVCLLEISSN